MVTGSKRVKLEMEKEKKMVHRVKEEEEEEKTEVAMGGEEEKYGKQMKKKKKKLGGLRTMPFILGKFKDDSVLIIFLISAKILSTHTHAHDDMTIDMLLGAQQQIERMLISSRIDVMNFGFID